MFGKLDRRGRGEERQRERERERERERFLAFGKLDRRIV